MSLNIQLSLVNLSPTEDSIENINHYKLNPWLVES